uniref:ATP synthase CF0, subunit A n=1 Tax=Dictyotopsis propagulifera TaxID=670095 RepID=UPI002E78D9D6|nr:ATP synthase CF0, subunit A [Dictyotopsis propagulifera]WAM63225.1 ATP synthase CF0, subunit A [Dictyotopsis propagulifera]
MNIGQNMRFNSILFLSDIEVGKHLYWEFFGITFHGQVLIVSSLVLLLIFSFSFWGTYNKHLIPTTGQNFMELVILFIKDIAVNQIGSHYYKRWLPFVGNLFLFIFGCNLAGALLPWKLVKLPEGELGAPTNDINTTVALALLTSFMYFYAGISKKGFGYFKRYIEPTPLLLPINILEDFTKPLSLSFRLFGNILADELTVSVLVLLVPLVAPLPVMALGVFASSIQALIFSTLAAAYIGESIEGEEEEENFQNPEMSDSSKNMNLTSI